MDIDGRGDELAGEDKGILAHIATAISLVSQGEGRFVLRDNAAVRRQLLNNDRHSTFSSFRSRHQSEIIGPGWHRVSRKFLQKRIGLLVATPTQISQAIAALATGDIGSAQ